MGGFVILRKFFIVLLLFFGLVLTACGSLNEGAKTGSAGSARTYAIDDQFKTMHKRMDEICGQAISPLFEKKGKKYQYTVSCLFVNDPAQSVIKINSLAPLGYQWHVKEPDEPEPEEEGKLYLNGHVVWEEVEEIYYKKYGSGIIGLPLTGVHYDPTRKRYEQYFENMGFYRFVDEPEFQVHLMPYGSWMCQKACLQVDVIPNAIPVKPPAPDDLVLQAAEEAFLSTADRWGRDFVGLPLSTTYLAQDGMYEKVFENMVMYASPDSLARVQLRPLPQIVRIEPEMPGPPFDDPLMVFVKTIGELGYNVPVQFWTYITLHGTVEISGNPITELHRYGTGVSRQCFTNFCLEYHKSAPEDLKVRPSALGLSYTLAPALILPTDLPTSEPQSATQPTEIPTPEPQQVYVEPPTPTTPPLPTPTMPPQPLPTTPAQPTHIPQKIEVKVWERFSMLPPNQVQEIGVALFEGFQPLSGVGFSCTVFLPDGVALTTVMPPTSLSGQTSVTLDPIDIPIGTIVPYQVCITNLLEIPVCVSDSFMIWDGQE